MKKNKFLSIKVPKQGTQVLRDKRKAAQVLVKLRKVAGVTNVGR